MDKWINVKKAGELLGISERAIRIKANNHEFTYKYVKWRGGKKMEILLSSLPEDAIARYYHCEPVRNEVEELEGFSKSQQAEANNKAWVVELYQKREKGMSTDAFVEWYNHEFDKPITKANIFQWQKKMKEGGTAALVDRRGEHKRGKTTIPDAAWDYFNALYMTQEKRGVQLCYDYTKEKFPDIPSVYAFHRKVKTIPEHAMIYYREGENALRDVLPSMDRDKTDIASNDIWFSDHHRVDVFTRNEDGSRLCRLWLTVFFDARSNKVISYICRNADPAADVIKQTMKKGMELHGIPKEVYFDNGKDYRSKVFRQDFPLSLVHQLGINSIYATPYHGQAKTVERFFRTFEERFGKMFPTYTGKDAKNRPEKMRISDEKILAIAPSIETFLTALDNYMEDYNHTPSRGKNLEGKSPDEVYYQNLSVKREITDRKALALLCGTFDMRTVHKSGITFRNRVYWDKALLPYFKKKVIINYDSENLDVLNVFDEDMRAVCMAKANVRTPFRNTTEADYKKAMKQKKQARQMVEKYRPQMELDTMSMISKIQLAEQAAKDSAYKPAAVSGVTPKFDIGAFEGNRSSRGIKPGEPDLQKSLLEKYMEESKIRKIGGM
ncbi:MAG: DDE-type integrase/transposase/recombinase [Lachnospiraceae bacterium]|nr:DDE-type integrase/transposase/recombinase [Lachnospiraceae bacterium]